MMESPSAFRFPSASPNMPLHALSPERVNAAMGPRTPLVSSPSIPNFENRSSHMKTSSDVQGMVARFNSLDIKDHAELRRRDEAALKRAQMGREEAEAELSKVKEDNRRMKKEADETRDREMKMMKRLEVLMEDLHRAKETQSHTKALYEKEIRKCRNESLKYSSIHVKLQEELKSTRSSLRVVQTDLETAKGKVSQRDEEAFTARYQLVGVQEALEQLQARFRIVQEERDALKNSLKEEEVARIAAEGQIALPISDEPDDEFASPKKSREPNIELERPKTPKASIEIDQLREEVYRQKRKRESAEEQIEFMKMECQFQCCSCRVAEHQGTVFVHDKVDNEELFTFRPAVTEIEIEPEIDDKEAPVITIVDSSVAGPVASTEVVFSANSNEGTRSPLQRTNANLTQIDEYQQPQKYTRHDTDGFSLEQPTAHNAIDIRNGAAMSSDTRTRQQPREEVEPEYDYSKASELRAKETSVRHSPSYESADDADVRLITTTTKVPLVDVSSPVYNDDYASFAAGTTITREEALERIRERRGRARSVNATPKKRPATPAGRSTNGTPRRDISAPEARSVSRGRKGANWSR